MPGMVSIVVTFMGQIGVIHSVRFNKRSLIEGTVLIEVLLLHRDVLHVDNSISNANHLSTAYSVSMDFPMVLDKVVFTSLVYLGAERLVT